MAMAARPAGRLLTRGNLEAASRERGKAAIALRSSSFSVESDTWHHRIYVVDTPRGSVRISLNPVQCNVKTARKYSTDSNSYSKDNRSYSEDSNRFSKESGGYSNSKSKEYRASFPSSSPSPSSFPTSSSSSSKPQSPKRFGSQKDQTFASRNQQEENGRSNFFRQQRNPNPSPTVPLPPSLKENEWTRSDVAAVNRAISDSLHLAPKMAAVPRGENGDNVLLGRSEEELGNLAVELGEQKYRGRQLHQFMYKNKGTDFMDLPIVPQQFRDELQKRGFRVGRLPVHHVAASADGTAKLLLRLEDARLVETVGIPMEAEKGVQKLTACVSSQVGCPLKCSFCATGKGGFARNLRPHEIVAQVLAIEELFRHRVNNIVFMGMGEPLLNLPSVLAAHRCLNKDLGIGQRMMTISTVGVPNTIRRLASHKLQSTLAISLHAPNQRLREILVPSAKAYPLEALLSDCKHYFEATGRRVSFEYTLLAAVNDQESHARELAGLLRQWNLGRHVNVIPYNPVKDSTYRRPDKAHVMAFADALKRENVTVTIRQTRGMDANAACGQLRNDFQKSPLTVENV